MYSLAQDNYNNAQAEDACLAELHNVANIFLFKFISFDIISGLLTAVMDVILNTAANVQYSRR